jgi:hypothetical protein
MSLLRKVYAGGVVDHRDHTLAADLDDLGDEVEPDQLLADWIDGVLELGVGVEHRRLGRHDRPITWGHVVVGRSGERRKQLAVRHPQ